MSARADRLNRATRWLAMASLVLAGGIIYGLPYLRQSYHVTMREVLAVTNTQLGFMNSMFGLLALACYFPGGWLADRFSARKLLTISLLGTGLGGFAFATFPPYGWILAIHAFWGVSSILTFWGALIRATRSWGGEAEQGFAFGVLDSGRGLVEAPLSAVVVLIFGLFSLPGAGLAGVIVSYSVACLFSAGLVWLFIPESKPPSPRPLGPSKDGGSVLEALRLPPVWVLGGVIFFAYAAFFGTFDFTAYAQDGYGQSAFHAAALGNFRMWTRPVAAFVAGIVADRLAPSRVVAWSFIFVGIGYGLLAAFPPGPIWVLWTEAGVVALAVFALRGVYYALMQEGRIPLALTGTAVGVVSVIGYTPDIFLPVGVGLLVDAFPGDVGHRIYYGGLAFSALLGTSASLLLPWVGRRC